MRKYHIIHVDDHSLITVGIGNLSGKIIQGCEFKAFGDGDIALDYIRNSMEKNEAIDLLITDFVHPGLDGYEFAKAIRRLEKKNKLQPLPILLLTMLSDTQPMIRKGLKQGIFNKYLPLIASESELTQGIRTIIYPQKTEYI